MSEEKTKIGPNRKKIAMEMRKHVKNMSKEVLEATLIKRRECIKKAQEVVFRLIEPNVDADWMLENLVHVNQTHFDDIVEERFVTLLCGYPLCGTLLRDIPKQQYVISTKTNKVYDITDRKKYCSNFCYKASQFIREQMYTSPIWLRDFEEDITFQLFDVETLRESAGVEMNIGLTEQINAESINSSKEIGTEGNKKEINSGQEQKNLKVEVEEQAKSLEKIKLEEEHGNIQTKKKVKKKVIFKEGESANKLYQEGEEQEEDRSSNKDEILENKKIERENIPVLSEEQNLLEKEGDRDKIKEEKVHGGNKKDVESYRVASAIRARNKIRISLKDVVINIEKKVREWFTVESLRHLLGPVIVTNMFKEVGFDDTQLNRDTSNDPYNSDKYAELCSRLAAAEIQEEREGKAEMVPKKPLPDFERLKEEAKDLQIKVKAFYRGDKVVTFEEPSSNEPAKVPVFPCIHHQAAETTRKNILLNKLSKALVDMQSVIGLPPELDLTQELKTLIMTFNLGPNNIIFKPSELGLVSIMIIKMLTLRNEQLRTLFNSKLVYGSVEQILVTFELDEGYLDRLVSYLTNIGPLLPQKH